MNRPRLYGVLVSDKTTSPRKIIQTSRTAYSILLSLFILILAYLFNYLWPSAMVRPNAFALRTALHAAQPSLRPTCITVRQRQFGALPRQYADDKGHSFKNQLYESTQQRLKRERAEQERFSQYQTQSPGGRYAAMMFGTQIPRH